jgi:carnosine N-methyltransferase
MGNTIGSYIPPDPKSPYSEATDILSLCLLNYSKDITESDIHRIVNSFNSLSDDDLDWIRRINSGRENLVLKISDNLKINQKFLNELIKFRSVVVPVSPPRPNQIHPFMLDALATRVRALPGLIARDWSDSVERDQVNGAVLEALSRLVSNPVHESVLIPGSGLGRLVYDVAATGREVTGIEFDALKLMVSHLILHGDKFEICPHLTETINRRQPGDHLEVVEVPSVSLDPETLKRIHIDGNEFLRSVSGSKGKYDFVITTFFLDTAVDVIDFIHAIHGVLKPRGRWINCGPLQYTYPSDKDGFVPKREAPWDVIRSDIQSAGFGITEEKIIVTEYLGNPKSLMSTKLKCIFTISTRL